MLTFAKACCAKYVMSAAQREQQLAGESAVGAKEGTRAIDAMSTTQQEQQLVGEQHRYAVDTMSAE